MKRNRFFSLAFFANIVAPILVAIVAIFQYFVMEGQKNIMSTQSIVMENQQEIMRFQVELQKSQVLIEEINARDRFTLRRRPEFSLDKTTTASEFTLTRISGVAQVQDVDSLSILEIVSFTSCISIDQIDKKIPDYRYVFDYKTDAAGLSIPNEKNNLVTIKVKDIVDHSEEIEKILNNTCGDNFKLYEVTPGIFYSISYYDPHTSNDSDKTAILALNPVGPGFLVSTENIPERPDPDSNCVLYLSDDPKDIVRRFGNSISGTCRF